MTEQEFRNQELFACACNDPEDLRHDSLCDCLAECECEGAESVVTAYKRKVLSKKFSEEALDQFMSHTLEEFWGESYGDYDGTPHGGPLHKATPEQEAELRESLAYTLHEALVKYSHVWLCDEVETEIFIKEAK